MSAVRSESSATDLLRLLPSVEKVLMALEGADAQLPEGVVGAAGHGMGPWRGGGPWRVVQGLGGHRVLTETTGLLGRFLAAGCGAFACTPIFGRARGNGAANEGVLDPTRTRPARVGVSWGPT